MVADITQIGVGKRGVFRCVAGFFVDVIGVQQARRPHPAPDAAVARASISGT